MLYITLYPILAAVLSSYIRTTVSLPIVRRGGYTTYTSPLSLSMMNGNNDQLFFIQKYKYLFDREPYNNFMQDVLNDNIKNVFIDNTYKQLVGVDNFQEKFNDFLMNDQFFV